MARSWTWRTFDAVAILIALVGFLVPRRHRHWWLIRTALWTTPIHAWCTSRCGSREGALGTDAEQTLYTVLLRATQLGLEFDLPMEEEGGADLHRLVAEQRGVMFVGVHNLLTYLVPRHLIDVGIEPVVIAVNLRRRTLGRRDKPDYIAATSSRLRRVQQSLKAGRAVCGMIDLPGPGRRAVRRNIAGHDLWLTDAPFLIAREARASVLFGYVRLDRRGKLVIRFACPTDMDAAVPAHVLDQFCDFLAPQLPPIRQGAALPDRSATADADTIIHQPAGS